MDTTELPENDDSSNNKYTPSSPFRSIASSLTGTSFRSYPSTPSSLCSTPSRHIGGGEIEEIPSWRFLSSSFREVFRPRFRRYDDPVPAIEDLQIYQHARESTMQWVSSSSPYLPTGIKDPNAAFPYLPPVLQEPSSSFPEVAEDDPLPAIEGLRISGEAYPGRELQACGYSTNGTTSCNFKWMRYLEDGSVNYIEGAKQPTYIVTADDVGSYLAVEVRPLANRGRKGELVKVCANDQRKISCDPEMQEQIVSILSVGHASFEVSISAGFLNIWEHALLAIKMEGYSVKCSGRRGVVVKEKFALHTKITIPFGQATEFSIQSADGAKRLLQTANNSSLRDTIVLTLRLFKMRALERRKGRRKVLFF